MAYEALAWPSPPEVTDASDGTQAYNMGIRFGVTEPVPCPGVRWRVPDTVATTPPGGSHVASLWRVSDALRIAFANFVPVPGGDQDVLFPVPPDLDPAENYVAAVYTVHYVYRPSGGIYPSTPSGVATGVEGRLVPYNSGPLIYPGDAFGTWYYVSPLIEVADEPVDEVLDVGPARTMPGAAAVTFAAGGLLTAVPAAVLPGGSTVALRRGDVLTARPAGGLPGPGRATFTEIDPSAGTSSLNPALLTTTRSRVESTTSRPHVLTTGAL